MKRLALFTLLLVGLSTQAQADPITFSGTSGDLAASATFATSGSNLIITLTNTSLFDALVPADILTALFFDIDGFAGVLTPISAVLGPGSTVVNGSAPGGNVGGEWAYEDGISGATPEGQNHGIGSAGLGIFGAFNFGGPNLVDQNAVQGLPYGITSAGDNSATGNSPLQTNPLIQNSVIFTLSGVPLGFDPSAQISNIFFQYGTSLSEGGISVPEPTSLLLVGPGVALLFVGRLRSRRKRQQSQLES